MRKQRRKQRFEPKLVLDSTFVDSNVAPACEAPSEQPKQYWRALHEKPASEAEFPELQRAAEDLSAANGLAGEGVKVEVVAEEPKSGTTRRGFMGLVGSGMAAATLAGCIRKPEQHILPYNNRPEMQIPGKPRYFATTMLSGSEVLGLVVESQDGRPTKIEGNFRHPMNKGRVNHWAQASVLELWNADRAQVPSKLDPHSGAAKKKDAHGGGHGAAAAHGGDDNPFKTHVAKGRAKVDLEYVRKKLDALGEAASKNEGDGLALLVDARPSPTYAALIEQIKTRLPKSRIYRHEPADTNNARDGAAMVGAAYMRPIYQLHRAKVIVAIDCDFLGTEGDTVRNARLFAQRRRVASTASKMNRLYAVEPAVSLTGATADHRLTLPASKCGEMLAAIAQAMFNSGVNAPQGAEALVAALKSRKGLDGEQRGKPRRPSLAKWADEVAKDLRDAPNRKQSAIIVGERQPPEVHALAHLLNEMLGNNGRAIEFVNEMDRPPASSMAHLVRDAASIKTLIVIADNPVFSAPVDIKLGAALSKIADTIHLSDHVNETSAHCKLHVPRSHFLETWGDLRAIDGTFAIQQPLIAPLYKSLNEIEVLARLLGEKDASPYTQVRAHFTSRVSPGPQAETVWRYALHDGRLIRKLVPASARFEWSKIGAAWGARKVTPWPTPKSLEVTLGLDWSTYDGRYGHNGWLLEVPDPLSKLSWDNALLLGPETARKVGVTSGDMCTLSAGESKLTAAVWVIPGVATGSAVVQLGWGRTAGPKLAHGRGFNGYALRTSKTPWVISGGSLARGRGTYKLVTTQEYGSLTPSTNVAHGLPQTPGKAFYTSKTRPLVREATLTEYKKNPKFVEKFEVMPKDKLTQLWESPADYSKGQQWGMSIDLNTCTGCNSCLLACISENNISIVGKDRVANGRELHWIRLDRYYAGDEEQPEVVIQPMPCQQCENAPCEQVCPVAATMHSPDGLNDMVYNRCIGTRYCSNNCPYKVRRFNYFNFSKENDHANPLLTMQRNPDVSVRFRGVMEKCTYCVQRISEARHSALRVQRDKVPDGAIVPACAQTCPTDSIVFGDINDPSSRVSRLKKQDRDYTLLRELNNRPRTTYLAKIRNPNPRLV
ncbi:MAG: 4Fe-4S dicluster domain-containing protein [Myxococcales bacterium]|nr:4Fe-4S dicluster domain-containing protein [Myxococcales bacterium]